MVEIWPFAERSHGIAFFQLFGRLAGFFTTFVNPIGLKNAGWKYLISYCCFLAYEVVFVYFMFPETFGRTLEELAFCKFYNRRPHRSRNCLRSIISLTLFYHSVRGQGAGRPSRQCRREGCRRSRRAPSVEEVYRGGGQEGRNLKRAGNAIIIRIRPLVEWQIIMDSCPQPSSI